MAREVGGAHEAQRRKLGIGDLQQPFDLVDGVLRGPFVVEEIQAMHLDQRRTPGARVRSQCLECALVRHTERWLQIAVAHDIRHAVWARRRVEIRALAGDDVTIRVAAFVA